MPRTSVEYKEALTTLWNNQEHETNQRATVRLDIYKLIKNQILTKNHQKIKKNQNSTENRKCTKNEIGHHITFYERSRTGSKTMRTATTSSITSLRSEVLKRNTKFQEVKKP